MLSILPLFAVVAAPSHASAATTKETVCSAIGSDAACTDASGTNVNGIITSLINILSIVVGVIAVIMIIFAGAKYITSGGDTQKVTSAKNALIYAIIGLVIVALAQVIVHFVLSKTKDATTPKPVTSIVRLAPLS